MQSWCRNRTARNSCPAPSCRGACLDLVVRTSDDSSREVSSVFQGLLVVLSLNQLEAHEGRDLSTKYLLLVLPAPQFSSVAQSCPALCDPVDCSMPGFPVHHQLLELAQTHAHRVGDAIQPSHPLSSPSPPAFNLLQHRGLFQSVSSSHQVARVLEFQLQHQSFQ